MGILNPVFVIIGIIIGAGFASGKEIYTFFFAYGTKGIIGLAISISLIGYIIYKSLEIIKKYDINNYGELLKRLITKEDQSINLKFILNFTINTFLLISFFVMCAGFSAYFKQEFGINEILASILFGTFCYIILTKNIKGIFLVNSLIIPLITIFLIILGVKSIQNMYLFDGKSVANIMWIPSSILYASYNSITLVSMLIPMKKYVNNRKDIITISLLCMLIIATFAFIIILLLLNINVDISRIDLPAVYASRPFWKNI